MSQTLKSCTNTLTRVDDLQVYSKLILSYFICLNCCHSLCNEEKLNIKQKNTASKYLHKHMTNLRPLMRLNCLAHSSSDTAYV